MSFSNENTAVPSLDSRRQMASSAARRGLDFLVRHQLTDADDANCGRLAYTYDALENRVLTFTTNWTSGVGLATLLLGYRVFGEPRYLEAARRCAGYLRSLQIFLPSQPRLAGIFNENTPQSAAFHPRDALTAAWALLDLSTYTDDADARLRATLYADWFVRHGFDAGYPRWTVDVEGGRFDHKPRWYGSFHSGSALFMARMHMLTRELKYREAMEAILKLYNQLMLEPDGRIRVVVDIAKREPIPDAEVDQTIAPLGWIRMHEYNDDFGALANLEAWKLTGDPAYREAAERFLGRMVSIQHSNGGFGPNGADAYTVPSAGGSVLLEMQAARALGSTLSLDAPIERALDYVLGLQVNRPGDPADGAFFGLSSAYALDGRSANIRSGGYAILALLHYIGASDPIYFPGQ